MFRAQKKKKKTEKKILFTLFFLHLRKLSIAIAFSPSPFSPEAQMALLAGRPRPPALIGARRDRGGQGKNPPAATDRSPPQHQLLVSSPFPPPLPLLHRNGQLHGRRTSLFVTLAAAAAQAGSDGQQQQPQQKQMFQQRLAAAQASKKKKPPLPARLLSSFLATSSVPYR